MTAVANHTVKHQLEVKLWLRELGFLNDQINIMKRHLHDVNQSANSEDVLTMVGHFSESFSIQKKWLHRMKEQLENIALPREDDWEAEYELTPSVKMFSLQMQANRIVNKELKDSVLKFLVKWM
jgi:hypothetical protein